MNDLIVESEWPQVEENCPICGGGKVLDLSRVVDRRKGISGSWMIAECRDCGVSYLTPQVTQEELRKYYAAYGSPIEIKTERGWGTRHPSARRIFHKISGDVDPRDFVRIKRGERLLDYGCGGGSYLQYFKERGAVVSGAELSEAFVSSCEKKGLDVKLVSDMNVMPFEDEAFDVVYLAQVFEHFARPRQMLGELRRVLRPSGTVYLALPNKASYWRRIFGKNWVSGWFPPFHLFHYDENSLGKLAQDTGFVVVRSWTATPERWFRLNLRAIINSSSNRLDATKSILDTWFLRSILVIFLRLAEILIEQRDCLVIELKRR